MSPSLTAFKMVRTLWLVETAAMVVLLLGFPALIRRPATVEGPTELVARIFYVAGLVNLALAWWMKNRTMAAAREHPPALAGGSIVAVTLATTPGILGAVLYLGFGYSDGQRILGLASLIGLWLLRPRADEWEEVLTR